MTNSSFERRGRALACGLTALAGGLAGLAGAVATPALASPVAQQVQAGAPLSKAGPGWTILQYSSGRINGSTFTGRFTLYLTSPQGKKYALYSAKLLRSGPNLLAWSGDRQRALLSTQVTAAASDQLEQVDLATGKVLGRFSLPKGSFAVGYTKPDGLNVLAVRRQGSDWQLVRYNLSGQQQAILATIGGTNYEGTIYAPDGSYLLATTASGLAEVSNTGGILRRFTPSQPVTECFPDRWWNAATVLATCYPKHPSGANGRLWLFDVKTGRVSTLSTPSASFSENDAWRLPSGIYMQDAGAPVCGIIAQQYRDGSTHIVHVPGNPGATIITSIGPRLLVLGEATCGNGRSSLILFNPARHTVSYVLRPKKNTLGEVAAVPFGGRLIQD